MITIIRTERRCPRCGRVLPAAEFGRNEYTADGLQAYCRECTRAYFAEYRKRTPKKKLPADYVPMSRRSKAERSRRRSELYQKRMRRMMSEKPEEYAAYIAKRRAYMREYRKKQMTNQ